ncbi:ATP-binding cassette domain-containing protein [Shinella kummerowiae]|uniref:ATP-binding cassette domain-containing protein n=1 Tax=Shinella kummerowiae TaxID=417745 RepID=A0A6N8SGS8_9HYPH|nr:ABC transporter ATP-binding protein [Shinella kummerowiae]MXN48255.1 ATP-binding cassette domain-containing protein [Shinella kummerowiae]
MSDRAFLSLENLTLSYGNSIAVDKFNLDIRKGELVAFLGPSGCGKTTTMRSIAGLLTPTAGRITLDGTDITRVSANKRNVGLVFQSYALFPHLTVYENVAFGLRLKRMSDADIDARVTAGIKSVGLSALSGRKPTELSGGQQQRVALARSMVMEPKVLLLDEPLSNLDARLRVEMRAELQRVQKETGVTMIFVTHDQAEALSLADRIVVMREGLIEQVGTPEEIYNNPASSFVADFVGFENVFALRGGKLATPGGAVALAEALPGDAAGLAWRPSGVALETGPFKGTVKSVSFTGNLREYLLETPLGPITAEVGAALPVHALGAELAFDLPLKAAAPLQRFA